MLKFRMLVDEKRYRYYQFKRTDGKDGLDDDETLITPSVTCAEKETGDDKTSVMISNVTVFDNTKVQYLLTGAAAGNYYLTVSATTSFGQTVKGKVEIEVY